jgi:hypothetical protein
MSSSSNAGISADGRFVAFVTRDFDTDFADDVYLRTAISAEANGWANFGYVKMPEYRWGVLLALFPYVARQYRARQRRRQAFFSGLSSYAPATARTSGSVGERSCSIVTQGRSPVAPHVAR